MISAELNSNTIELAPGGKAEIVCRIENTSSIIDSYRVDLLPVQTQDKIGADLSWLQLNQYEFHLRPVIDGLTAQLGDTMQLVKIAIQLPPAIYAGTYYVQLNIIAGSGPENSAFLPFNIVVSEVEQQVIQLEPITQTSKRATESFRVLLANNGNVPHLYPVFAEDPENECRYVVSPPEVTLKPGEQAFLTLRVRPRKRNWFGQDEAYKFKVHLEGYNNAPLEGTFIQRCAFFKMAWLERAWMKVSLFLMLFSMAVVAIVVILLALLNGKSQDNICGPVSQRQVQVVSNNVKTSIFVSQPQGQMPYTNLVSQPASSLPGLFGSLVSVSPDGRYLAYVTADNESLTNAIIHVVNIPTKQERTQIPVATGLWPSAPLWSADGQHLLYVTTGGTADAAATTTTVAATTTISGTATGAITATQTPTPTPTLAASTSVTSTTAYPLLSLHQVEITDAEVKAAADMKVDAPYATDVNVNLVTGAPFEGKSPSMCWNLTNTGVIVQPKNDNKPFLVQLSGATVKLEKVDTSQLTNAISMYNPLQNFNPLARYGFYMIGANVDADSVTPTAQPLPQQSQAPGSGCPINSPISQEDPRWSNTLINGNLSNATVGNNGCALTAMAILLNDYGITKDTITPAFMATCLGGDSLPLQQDGWINLAGTSCSNSNGQVSFVNRGAFSWDTLNSSLRSSPTIVGMLGGPSGSHFVVVTGGHDGIASTYTVVDPWDGSSNKKTLASYLQWGYQLRWVVSYTGKTLTNCVTSDSSTTTNAATSATTVKGSSGQNSSSSTSKDLTAASINIDGVVDGGLYKGPVELSFSVPGLSPTATLQYFSPTDDPDITTSPVPINQGVATTLDKPGFYWLDIVVPNGSNPIVRRVSFTIDNVAPDLAVDADASSPVFSATTTSGHYYVPATVTLHPADSLSGIAFITYTRGTESPVSYQSDTAVNKITFDQAGTFLVDYQSEDGAGNVADESYTFYIDNAPITGTAVVTPTNGADGGTNTGGASNQAAPITVSDGGQGVAVPTVTPALVINQNTQASATDTVTTPPPATTTIATITTTDTVTPTVTPTITTTATVTGTTTITVTTTPTITTTPLPPSLAVSTTTLAFSTALNSQPFTMTNTGGSALVWSATSNSYLAFSPSSGSIDPGSSITMTVQTITTPVTSNLATNFTVSSATTSQSIPIAVTIAQAVLPSGTFVLPTSSNELSSTQSIQLQVTTPTGALTANHATVYAIYQAVSGSTVTTTTPIQLSPSSATLWTGTLDTSNFPAQQNISIVGKLCTTTDDSICSTIPTVSNLTVTSDAPIQSPTSNSVLSDTTTVVVSPHGRVDHVILSASYDGTTVAVSNQLNSTDNWTASWDTTLLPPYTPITLTGQVCSTAFSNSCQSFPANEAVTNLQTQMDASLTFSPSLQSNSILPGSINILAEPTRNVNHISLYATYAVSPTVSSTQSKQLISNVVLNQNSWNTTWTPTIPAQNNISLEFDACFSSDETDCVVLPNYNFTNLQVVANAQWVITPNVSTLSAEIGTFFPQSVQITLTDSSNKPITNTQVTFSTPNTTSSASGLFSTTTGLVNSEQVTTNNSGVATADILRANSQIGSFYVTISAGTSTSQASATVLAYNTSPNATPIQATGSFSAPINTAFSPSVKIVLKDNNGNPISDTQVTLFTPSDSSQPSGVFSVTGSSGSYTTTTETVNTDNSGVADTGTLIANSHIGNYTLVATTNSPLFNPTSFTLTNEPGPAASIGISGTNVFTGFVVTTLSSHFVVTVTDAYGNRVEDGTPVTFNAPSSGASGYFSTTGSYTATVTTSNGVATSPDYQLSQIASTYNSSSSSYTPYIVTATVDVAGVTAASFQVTNYPQSPAAVLFGNNGKINSTNQAVVDNAYGTATANLVDQFGNPIPNYSLVFTVPNTTTSASGFFNGNSSTFTYTGTTDANGGVTTPQLTANSHTGSFDLIASCSNCTRAVRTATMTLKNLPGAAASIQATNGTIFTTTVNSAFSQNLTLNVLDADLNVVSQTNVLFTTPAYSASTPTACFSTSICSSSSAYSQTLSDSQSGAITLTNLFASQTASTSSYQLTAEVVDSSGTAINDSNGHPITYQFSLNNLPSNPSLLQIYPGSSNVSQAITVGQTITNAFSVQVLDAYGNPVNNVQVQFQQGSGDDTCVSNNSCVGGIFPNSSTIVTATTARTTVNTVQVDGYANSGNYSANHLTTVEGATYNVVATLPQYSSASPFTFTVSNIPDVPNTLSVNAGSSQSAVVNNPFGTNLQVQAYDQYNNVAYSAPLSFTAPTSGATADFYNATTSITATTDSSGIAIEPITATTTASFGSSTYTVTVAAQTSTATTNITGLKNLPDVPYVITATAPLSLSPVVNTSYSSAPFTVTVEDQYSNPVPSETISFTLSNCTSSSGCGNFVTSSSALTSTYTTTTDNSGSANASADGFKAGPLASTNNAHYNVVATVLGTSPTLSASYTMTNVAGAPNSIMAITPVNSSVVVSTSFATAPEVYVTDSFGNAVPDGTSVTFTAGNSTDPNPATAYLNGVFGGQQSVSVSTSNGYATVPNLPLANQYVGTYYIQVQTGALPAQNIFTVTNTHNPYARLNSLPPTSEAITVTQDFTSTLSADVVDTYGNPITDTTVTFQVISGTTTANGQPAGSFNIAGSYSATDVEPTTGTNTFVSKVISANQAVGTFQVEITCQSSPTDYCSSLNGTTPLTYTLTNTPDAAAVLTVDMPSKTTIVNTNFSNPITVTVQDAHGNNVADGTSVNFTIGSSGSASATFTSNSSNTVTLSTVNGIVTTSSLLASTTAGNYPVTITSGGASQVITLTNIHNNNVTPSAVNPSQTVTVTQSYAPLALLLQDSYNNPVTDTVVTFTIPSGTTYGSFPGGVSTANGTSQYPTSNDYNSPVIASTTKSGTFYVTATCSTYCSTPITYTLTNNPSVPVTLTVTPTTQSTTVGTNFGSALTAALVDVYGNNVSDGTQVNFTINTDASTNGSATFTSNNSNTVTLGTTSGSVTTSNIQANHYYGIYTATVMAVGYPATSQVVTFTNVHNSSINLIAAGANPSTTVTIGQTYNWLNLRIQDSYGNPVTDTSAIFTITDTSYGTFAGGAASSTTTSSIAPTSDTYESAAITSTTKAGSFTVTASCTTSAYCASNSTTFTLTNKPAAANKFVLQSAASTNPQSVQISQTYQSIILQLQDVYNNPIANESLTIQQTCSSGGACATSSSLPSSPTTDSSGDITLTPQANGTVGSFIITVKDTNVIPNVTYIINLTNTTGPAQNLTVTSGSSSESITVTNAFTPITLQLTDAGGNPISNTPVTFTLSCTATTACTNPATTVIANTDTTGKVTYSPVANTIAGTYTVSVSATYNSGTANSTITLTNLADVPAYLAVTSGNSQAVAANSTYGSIVLTITDTYGNPVSGTTVDFTPNCTTSSACINPANSFTGTSDSTGTITVSNLVADRHSTHTGPFTITAKSAVSSSVTATISLYINPGNPSNLTVTANNNQTATVGATYLPVTLLLTDSNGNPVPNKTISFTQTCNSVTNACATSASVPASDTTDSSGSVTITPTANSYSGAFTITAKYTNGFTTLTANIYLANTAGASSQWVLKSGSNNQSVVISNTYSSITLQLQDALGNGVANHSVTVQQTCGSSGACAQTSSLPSSPTTTDSSGNLTLTPKANGKAGSFTITVADASNTSVNYTINLTINVGSATYLTLTSGNNITATVGTTYQPVTLSLTDAGGNTLSGTAVSFTANNGSTGASATGASVPGSKNTDSSGSVSITPFANNYAGTFTIVATSGSASATITLTNEPAAASKIVLNSGSSTQSVPISTTYSAITLQVEDTYNNPVPNENVTIQQTCGSSGACATTASVPTSGTTDANGDITLTPFANGKAGSFTITVIDVSSSANYIINLTITTGSAQSLALNSGSTTQSVTVGNSFTPVSFLLTDAGGNILSNTTVTFAPSCSTSACTNPTGATTLNTDSSGVVTYTAVANNYSGTYTVTVTSGAATATLNLTNTAGAANKFVLLSGSNPASTQISTTFGTLVLQAQDSNGNPRPGDTITLTQSCPTSACAVSGSYATAPSASVTGTITLAPQANGTVGSFVITATDGTATPYGMTFNITTGPAALITAYQGDDQAGVGGNSFGQNLIALVTDAGGNPVNNATVKFNGTTNVTTDSSGHATASLNANSTSSSSTYYISAAINGGSCGSSTAGQNGNNCYNFTLTSYNNLNITVSPSTNVTVTTTSTGSPYIYDVSVLVTTTISSASQTVEGLPVTFNLQGGAHNLGFGSTSGPTNITVYSDASGVASVTVESTAKLTSFDNEYIQVSSSSGVTETNWPPNLHNSGDIVLQ